MKRALITGISGQDGANLARHLLDEGYEVWGMLRRQSVSENQDSRISGLPIETLYGDMTDAGSVRQIVKETRPCEIYSLASQSHVRVSFDVPEYTLQVNTIGTLHILNAMQEFARNSRLYFAGSSEMFGNSVDSDGFQRETTRMDPTSPYGIAKLAGFKLVQHFRRAYGLFCSSGILFNHGSAYRGSNFVEAKIAKAAVEISLGLRHKLELGDLRIERDWGHSKDYVKAMRLILQHKVADDFVIATGKSTSLSDLCAYAFQVVGKAPWHRYVTQRATHYRPEELRILKGDAAKARRELGWQPQHTAQDVVNELIEHWRSYYAGTRRSLPVEG